MCMGIPTNLGWKHSELNRFSARHLLPIAKRLVPFNPLFLNSFAFAGFLGTGDHHSSLILPSSLNADGRESVHCKLKCWLASHTSVPRGPFIGVMLILYIFWMPGLNIGQQLAPSARTHSWECLQWKDLMHKAHAIATFILGDASRNSDYAITTMTHVVDPLLREEASDYVLNLESGVQSSCQVPRQWLVAKGPLKYLRVCE